MLLGMYFIRVLITMQVIEYLKHNYEDCNPRVKLGVTSIEVEFNTTEKNAGSGED